jgi:hypothetical protein
MTCFTVIYESGILKPMEPLDFAEGQQLQIQVVEASPDFNSLDVALQALVRSGALTLPEPNPQLPLLEVSFSSLAESELEVYGNNAQPSNLLSDSIIEDRGAL